MDDPYSHLPVQKLDILQENYNVEFQVHLVSSPAAAYRGSAEHFDRWAERDAQAIADGYGTKLKIEVTPGEDNVRHANAFLADKLASTTFAQAAFCVSTAPTIISNRLSPGHQPKWP